MKRCPVCDGVAKSDALSAWMTRQQILVYMSELRHLGVPAAPLRELATWVDTLRPCSCGGRSPFGFN